MGSGGRSVPEAMDDGEYSPGAQYHEWTDLTEGDIQMFFAHLMIMGLVKKPKLIKYWSRSEFVSTPFFGKYMTQKKFELILSQLHITSNSDDDKTDPLFKVRPFVSMCKKKFRSVYSPSKNLSLDETCCLFKGRLKFKVYNKSK